MVSYRSGGQTLHEMSEHQLKQLILDKTIPTNVHDECIRILQVKSKCRHQEARDKFRADEDFIRNNF